jgi:hypothetical protein
MRFELRKQVLLRDEYTCQTCYKSDPILEVHHLIPKRFGGLDSLNNLTTQCEKCHTLLNFSLIGIKKSSFIRSKMTRQEFVIKIDKDCLIPICNMWKNHSVKVTIEALD